MNTHELLKTLIEKGWVELSFPRFTEKIGQSADLYYSYDIPGGDQLDLCYFERDNSLKLRIYAVSDREKNWFGMNADVHLPAFLDKLTEMQNSISGASYFSFYFGIQDVSPDISILAWEQWEPNYR